MPRLCWAGPFFCWAMLCKRGLCHHVVSVCLSVMFVNYVKRSNRILKNFSMSGSHTILVFPYQTSWQYSNVDPPNGDVERMWGRQKSWLWDNNTWLHHVLLTLRRPGVINTVLPDHGKLWHLSLVVSGGVCWWRESMTKCLWQEVSTLRQRQQHLIVCSRKLTIKDCAWHFVLLKLTTNRHESSCGLFAIARATC